MGHVVRVPWDMLRGFDGTCCEGSHWTCCEGSMGCCESSMGHVARALELF